MRFPVASFLAAALVASAAAGQELRQRLDKPPHAFFYLQTALAGGYDSARADEGWGLAQRGAPTQVSFEWFVKDESQMQRGWVPWVAPGAWNVKFALELKPIAGHPDDSEVGLRLLDTWVQLGTKWDRTSWVLGHRSFPYGHNPRIDTDLSFLPNQSNLDLGFGADTGVFFRTPLAKAVDLELSGTAGGWLSGTPLVVRFTDGDSEVVDQLDYRGTWLATARVGSPTFSATEWGVFASSGKLHAAVGPLTEVTRVGGDWVVKRGESWRAVAQVAAGENRKAGEQWAVYNALQSIEWFASDRLRLGATHAARYEDVLRNGERPLRGTVFGMLSFVLARDARFRVNPFFEYYDETGSRDAGVLFQVCSGCGLKK